MKMKNIILLRAMCEGGGCLWLTLTAYSLPPRPHTHTHRGHPPAGQRHPGARLALQGEHQRHGELRLSRGQGHEVPAGVRGRQQDPPALARLAAAQGGQGGGSAHVRLPVRPHRKVSLKPPKNRPHFKWRKKS